MVNLHLAYTSKINPAGATPVLNQAQIWAGLQRKIRFAQEFVPVIESCDVLEDKDGVVTRVVNFKPGLGPKDKAKEVVRGYWPSWVDFEQEDGSHVRNIVSDGPSGDLDDLHMTYAFEFRYPNIQEGSKEAEEQLQKLKATSKKAVESSIEAIRQMVVDGRIKE
ncbi:Nn.00g065370.m01.CDS01 [Neocucurbitaria sp. VM-36]